MNTRNTFLDVSDSLLLIYFWFFSVVADDLESFCRVVQCLQSETVERCTFRPLHLPCLSVLVPNSVHFLVNPIIFFFNGNSEPLIELRKGGGHWCHLLREERRLRQTAQPFLSQGVGWTLRIRFCWGITLIRITGSVLNRWGSLAIT